MGILQNAINQMIGTAAIAARLNPELEKRTQIRGLKRGIEGLEKYSEQLEEVGAEERDVDIYDETVAKTEELLGEKYEELSKLEPVEKNIDKIIEHKRGAQNIREGTIRIDDTVAANQRAVNIQEKKSKQRENYLNFMGFMTDPTQIKSEFKRLTGGNK